MCVGGKVDGASESPRLLFHCGENVNTFSISARPQSVIHSKPQITPTVRGSVVTGRARLLGFRVGFGGQNPSLGTLRLLGFGLFRALGFSGLFQAFLVYPVAVGCRHFSA